MVKQYQAIGERGNPLQEVEQNFISDRESIVNAGLNQTNKQPQANPTVTFTVKACENNPGKKPAVEKRPYNKILNWEKCPYCTFKPKTYHSYHKHVKISPKGCKIRQYRILKWLEILIFMCQQLVTNAEKKTFALH